MSAAAKPGARSGDAGADAQAHTGTGADAEAHAGTGSVVDAHAGTGSHAGTRAVADAHARTGAVGDGATSDPAVAGAGASADTDADTDVDADVDAAVGPGAAVPSEAAETAKTAGGAETAKTAEAPRAVVDAAVAGADTSVKPVGARAYAGDRAGPDDRRAAWAWGLLVAFAVAALADLGSLVAGAESGHMMAKPLLMPLLAAYAAVRGAPRPLIAALLFGWGGDVFLLADADWAFLVGMGSFAAGHVCYLALFGRSRTSPLLGAGYAVALVTTVAFLWPDLPSELRVPVAGYSLLLTAMAFRASGLGLYAGLGGAFFLLSDTLIATGVAEWPQLPAPDFWIMLTYAAAQYLLARGVLGRRQEGPAAPPAYREGRTTV